MILVEKKSISPAFDQDTGSIGFEIFPKKSVKRAYKLELSSYRPKDSVVRLLDASGKMLLNERPSAFNETHHFLYIVRNLDAGTYFVEISDGFYYQIKEVRIPAAG
ncbi:hypothetical protein [Pontibacter sp. G13]|uniref:hypothetical protein n=1 Tax=Pontibacter sp. G13 TaxID=3074898 RepID=UPI00288B3DC2|nr:hypothetical protein [Pontibacter sp. G13]WNJ17717.1 hypothetical protein RJD25_22935 [Pontibacter sp. G13]